MKKTRRKKSRDTLPLRGFQLVQESLRLAQKGPRIPKRVQACSRGSKARPRGYKACPRGFKDWSIGSRFAQDSRVT
jgi:hypothetical protein